MCGIAGVLERSGSPVERELLKRMGDVIAHRGPDGEGQFRRRPGRARQPPPGDHRPHAGGRHADGVCATAATVITYNGEVYNFRELRPSSRPRGHAFRSHTDTEVVLNAYAAWGPECVERFNGMFAFAIWDRERSRALPRPRPLRDQAALLRRPRPGIPLRLGDQVDARASRAHGPGEPAAPARVLHLPEHLHRRDAVRRSAAAPARPPYDLARGRRSAQPAPYWDFDFVKTATAARPTSEYAEELDRLFQQAVQRQLVSRRPGRRTPQRRHGLRQHHGPRGRGAART